MLLHHLLYVARLKKIWLTGLYLFGHPHFGQQLQPEKTMIVTFSPLSMIDMFDGASLRLGVELPLNRNFALAAEAGPYLGYLKATKINPKGYLIRPSFKYYLKGKPGKFIGLQYQFKQQRFGFQDSIVMGDGSRIEKRYGMRRRLHSLVAQYGQVVPLGKNFRLEWHMGAGIRYIRSHNDLTPEENRGILTGEAGDCPVQEDIIRLTGTRIFPDFRAGIKIGHAFKI